MNPVFDLWANWLTTTQLLWFVAMPGIALASAIVWAIDKRNERKGKK
jgi:hypothetical protein